MGEMTFIKQGIATTIKANGDITSSIATQCDSCFNWSDPVGGLAIADTGNEVILWLCKDCRG